MKTQSKNPKRSSKTRNKVRTGCEEDSNYKSLLCERCSEEEGKVISSVHSIIKTETNTWGSHTVRPQRKKEKIKVLGSYRLLDGFLIMKDDSICRSLRLVTVKKSLETAHAGRNLPVKEFCYLRTVNLIAAVCWSVFGMKAAINYWDLIIQPLRDKEKKNKCSGCPDL